jgi:hypothetical protein
MEFIQKHIFTFLRILIGFVFIISALLKLAPIAPFENILISFNISNWLYAPYIARCIISFELAIGFFIIANVYTKNSLRVALYTLIVFSLFLMYIYSIGHSQQNCGCLGEVIELKPIESILKNCVLIAVILYCLKNHHKLQENEFKKIMPFIAGIIIIIAGAIPYLYNMPTRANEPSNYIIKPGMKISHQSIQQCILNTGDTVNFTHNKHILVFASLTCNSCKYAISKLENIHKYNQKFNISIIFLETPHKDSLLTQLKEKTGLQTIPYSFLSPEDFFKTSHNKLPFIVFVENGEIKNLRNYNDLYIGDIFTFFKQ